MKIRLSHILQVMSLFTLALGFSVLIWVNYCLYWPVRTLEIYNYSEPGVVQTQKDTYKIGDPVTYFLDYCKFTPVPANVQRTLVDGQIIILSNTTGYLPVGCKKTVVSTSIIPVTINPGKYFLDIKVDYQVNFFRTETVHYHTNYFNVIK